MGNEFEIEVWLPHNGDEDNYRYKSVWAGEGWEMALQKLREVKDDYPNNAVALTWR